MKRMRLLLLPIGAAVELLLLSVCWLVAAPCPRAARKLSDWAESALPGPRWYLGGD